ncbi:MAG: 30S ribosomal protein S3 [Ruminobacter sp.]|jgi:small subunit ribosomal protein S3|nr:30S ribosomal protein S3 [Ruminobacter sp.]
MGQKVNPNGIRLGITKQFNTTWFADNDDYRKNLSCDFKVREFIKKELKNAFVSRIVIDRPVKSIAVTIYSSKPREVYGEKGSKLDALRAKISQIANVPAIVKVAEIANPDIDAKLVADNICVQLEHRVMFRRAMKKAIQNAMKAGAKGIKVEASGRLGGAEIARSEWLREGRVPLHTLRADIDYAVSEAITTYGVIGVKVWIFKGEVLDGLPLDNTPAKPERKNDKNSRKRNFSNRNQANK